MNGPHLTLLSLLLLFAPPFVFASEPSSTALVAFDTASRAIETRLATEHVTPSFLTLTQDIRNRLHHGELVLENLTPAAQPSDALLHHWRGTIFIPGATAANFDHLLRNFNAYPQSFAPQVVRTRVLSSTQDHAIATLRIRQHHVLTVVMDQTYDVTFVARDHTHGFSISRSTRIDEIASPNTPTEHALSPADSHGFLYRQNTYWSYAEEPGGLLIQLESLSLTRNIPTGFAWAVRPFVDSIPRESLTFTLTSAAKALRQQEPAR
jgi:hypothetical protein